MITAPRLQVDSYQELLNLARNDETRLHDIEIRINWVRLNPIPALPYNTSVIP